MLVDSHAPVDLFALVPEGLLGFEPELEVLDRLLEDDLLFGQVRADMLKRYPKTATRGRKSTPVEVVLRMLVVKRLYGWSYAETEKFVSDSLILRQFCRVYFERVPDDTTLIRWAGCIGPTTLESLNARAVELAQQQKVTRGRKLRIDSVVVETDIGHPTDSRLLGDGVRVLSRLLRRAKHVLKQTEALPKELFRSRTRSVRRIAQQIHRTARRRGQEAAEELKDMYEKLLEISEATRRQVERVSGALREEAGEAAKRLVQQAEHFAPLVDQVITQAKRRVLQGESVPAKEKLLSLFEPHTQVHVRQKLGKAVEFGRKLLLDETEGGIVTRYQVLPEPGTEHPYFEASLTGHQKHFGRAPELLAGDRGFSSIRNEQMALEAGVKRVALPRTGRVSKERRELERSAWWRRAYRFRAGIEGRISVLRRKYGLERCRYRGENGMGRWIGWGILAHNLAKISQTVAARTA